MIVNVFGYAVFCAFRVVAVGIAIVIPNVLNFANFTAIVAGIIAIVTVSVIGYTGVSAACVVAKGIAIIIKAVGNYTSCSTFVALVVAIVVVNVSGYTSKVAIFFVANGVASVVPNVFNNIGSVMTTSLAEEVVIVINYVRRVTVVTATGSVTSIVTIVCVNVFDGANVSTTYIVTNGITSVGVNVTIDQTDVSAVVTSVITRTVINVGDGACVSAKFAADVAIVCVLMGNFASCTTNITFGITNIAPIVLGCASVVAIGSVASGIASVIPNMIDFARCTANVTIGIATINIVNVVTYFASCAANVASGVANIAPNVIGYASVVTARVVAGGIAIVGESVAGNFACVFAVFHVAVGIAIAIEYMVYLAFKSANITNSVAKTAVNVSRVGNFACITANVTSGVAIVIVCVNGHTDEVATCAVYITTTFKIVFDCEEVLTQGAAIVVIECIAACVFIIVRCNSYVVTVLTVTGCVTDIGVFVGIFTFVAANIAESITSVTINVRIGCAFCTANVTVVIAIMIINVRGNGACLSANVTGGITSVRVNVSGNFANMSASYAILTLANYVTSSVASVVINVVFYFANCAANVTGGVASVIVNVIGNAACLATNITISIAIVVVNVIGNAACLSTNVTSLVASVVINVSGNTAFCAANVAVGIASVVIFVGDGASVCTTLNVTIGIASVIEVMFSKSFANVSTTVCTFCIAITQKLVRSYSGFGTVFVVTVGVALICPIVFLVGNPFPLSGNANVFGYGCFRVPFRSVFVREPTQEIEFILLGSFEVGSNTAVVDLESFGNTINRISYGFRTEKYQGANSNCHQCEQNQPYNEAGIVLFRGFHVRHFLFLLKIRKMFALWGGIRTYFPTYKSYIKYYNIVLLQSQEFFRKKRIFCKTIVSVLSTK